MQGKNKGLISGTDLYATEEEKRRVCSKERKLK